MIEIFVQQWIDVLIGDSQYIQFLSYVPKILLAVIIPVFDDLYHKGAVWLNDMGEFLSSLTIGIKLRLRLQNGMMTREYFQRIIKPTSLMKSISF